MTARSLERARRRFPPPRPPASLPPTFTSYATQFELIASDGLFSGLRHLRYGTAQDDAMPFILTRTPQYVARETGKIPPVSYTKIQRYADRNADKLKAIAKFEKLRGMNTHTLE